MNILSTNKTIASLFYYIGKDEQKWDRQTKRRDDIDGQLECIGENLTIYFKYLRNVLTKDVYSVILTLEIYHIYQIHTGIVTKKWTTEGQINY